jgi:hypothetical protein
VTDRRSRLARSVEHRKRIVVFSVETASGSCSGGSFEVKLGGREGEDEGEEFMEEGFDLGLLGERDDVGAVEEGEDEAGGVEDSLTVIDRVFELMAGRRGRTVRAVGALGLSALDGFDLGDKGFGGEEALVVRFEGDGLVVEGFEEVLSVL